MPTQNIEKLVVQLSADIKKYDNAMRKAQGITNRHARKVESRFSKMNSNLVAGTARMGVALAGAFASRAALRGAQELIDSATRIENALKVAGLSGAELERVYEKLFESAQRNFAPFETLVNLYRGASIAQKELNATSEELLQFTENVALALRVSGKSAAESRGAIIQLTQAIGAGIVRAEEFNAIQEGALPINQAVAAGLRETGGSVAKLRTLVIDGKVSSEAYFRALEAGAVILKEKVAGAAQTVDQRLTNLRTSLVKSAGRFNDATDASDLLGKEIDKLADFVNDVNFDNLVTEIKKYADGVQWAIDVTRQWAETLGQVSGLENVGVDIARSDVGNALGFKSSKLIRDRTAGQFAPANPELQARIEEFARRQGVPENRKTGRLQETKINKVSLDDFPIDPDAADKAAKAQKRFDSEIQSLKDRTAAIQATTAAQAGLNPLIDDYGYAVEKAAATQDLLSASQRAGIKITPELRAKIDELADGYANAVVDAERLAESQDKIREAAEEMRNLGKDALGGFISDVTKGTSATQALANSLGKVADKLLEISLDSIFDGVGSGPGFGDFGKIFGFANGGIAARGKPLQTFAGGGVSKSAAIFGEAGPEAAVPLPDGRRIPVELRMPDLTKMKTGTETIRIQLQDDSGRMAEIADQRIQTNSGTIIEVAVKQSRQAATADFASNQLNARRRRFVS